MPFFAYCDRLLRKGELISWNIITRLKKKKKKNTPKNCEGHTCSSRAVCASSGIAGLQPPVYIYPLYEYETLISVTKKQYAVNDIILPVKAFLFPCVLSPSYSQSGWAGCGSEVYRGAGGGGIQANERLKVQREWKKEWNELGFRTCSYYKRKIKRSCVS